MKTKKMQVLNNKFDYPIDLMRLVAVQQNFNLLIHSKYLVAL